MIKNSRKLKATNHGVEAAKPAPVASAPKPQPVVTAAKPAPIVTAKATPVAATKKPAPAIQAAKPAATMTAPSPSPSAKSNRVSLELVKPGAKHVCVAGSFNEWKPEKTPLIRQGNDRWVGDLAVNPGRYEYLFVVDGQWLPDPNAKETVQNPFGGLNCVLTVSA